MQDEKLDGRKRPSGSPWTAVWFVVFCLLGCCTVYIYFAYKWYILHWNLVWLFGIVTFLSGIAWWLRARKRLLKKPKDHHIAGDGVSMGRETESKGKRGGGR